MRQAAARLAAAAAALLLGSAAPPGVDQARLMATDWAPTLADYRLFEDAGARRPAPGVTPYTLNTPLFTDYALKFRFVHLPAGQKAGFRAAGPLEFPVGTVLVKTFAYPADFRQPDKDVRFVETRLLVHRADGWAAATYVWNAGQTEAVLKRAGGRTPVGFTDAQGKAVSLDYAIPNANQCKQCHSADGEATPIGPTAANLNGPHDYGQGAVNQLGAWSAKGLLAGAPDPATVPALPRWDDPHAALGDRARAYLAVNCAHCHSRAGFASNSGLYLGFDETNLTNLGIGKRPVAAGRGSGGMQFAIDPGHPDRSILVYRMESNEPGVMMAQFGRTVVDAEGVALVRAWIAGLPPS